MEIKSQKNRITWLSTKLQILCMLQQLLLKSSYYFFGMVKLENRNNFIDRILKNRIKSRNDDQLFFVNSYFSLRNKYREKTIYPKQKVISVVYIKLNSSSNSSCKAKLLFFPIKSIFIIVFRWERELSSQFFITNSR